MANTDALEAIKDIKEAIEEYGSSIILRLETQNQATYDPRSPDTGVTVTDTPMKALISTEASKDLATSMPKDLIGTYEIAMKLYTTLELTKAYKIVYDGKEWEVLYPSKRVLQDTTLMYEVLVK